MRQIPPASLPRTLPPQPRPPRRWRAALGALLLAASATPALAGGKLTAKYVLTVAGVELGRGSVVVEADDTAYEMAGTARLTGILRAVSSGKGSAAARGAVSLDKLAPQVYAMSAEAEGKPEAVRLALTGGAITETAVEPPPKPLPDRVEILPAHLQNVIDPMSGAFVYVPGTADLVSAAACDRTIPVYDGRQRYDVVLSYLRTEQVKAPKGYAGPAVVCRAAYRPVAGHRPTRSTVKYMMENKEMYVWLVPVAGTRLMAPFRVSVATMIGTALLETVSFETEAKEKTLPVSAPKP